MNTTNHRYLRYFAVVSVMILCTFVLPHKIQAVTIDQGYFAACTSSNCSQSIDTGFQPKAVIFYWTEKTSFSTAISGDASGGWGFAASTTASTPVQRSVSVSDNDADTTSESSRYRSDTSSIVVLDEGASAGTMQRSGVTTFTSTGFDVAWTTTGATTGYMVHYLAIAGDDVIATDAGTLTLTTGTGSLSYSGLSFRPDFIMFAWTFTENVNTVTAGHEIGIGFATSSSAQVSMMSVNSDGVAANNNKRWQMQATSSIIMTTVASPALADSVTSFTQFEDNGFTVNKVDAPAANTPVFFLAIKGGKHNVGWFDRPTSAQSVATTSAGFTPKSLFMMSTGATTTANKGGAIAFGGGISMGSARNTASSSAIWFQDFNIDSSDANMNATSSFIAIEHIRTAGNLRSRASLTSFDTNGFTLNWSPATNESSKWFFWAMGDKTTFPYLSTDAATNVGVDGATLNSTISLTGGASVTTYGFAWGTRSDLVGGDTATTSTSGSLGNGGTFSKNVGTMKANTKYYFRAFGTNSADTGYGSIANLTTSSDSTVRRRIRLFQNAKIKVIHGKIKVQGI